jgi:uncharacterized membrane protein YcaP (DUF421 family)
METLVGFLWTIFQPVRDWLQRILGLERNLEDVSSVEMALRALLVYVLAVILVRIGSKRFLSQATAFDVIVAIMLGSILSRAINGSAPFLPTIAAGAALVGLHWFFALLTSRTDFAGPLLKGEPRLLIKDGEVQEEEMRKAKLSEHDLEQALRMGSKQSDPSKIRRAYLERNGSISVIPYRKEPEVLDVSVEEGVQNIRIKLE